MKNISDSVIQNLLDQGMPPGDQKISSQDKKEIKTYHLLFDLLDETPEGSLPMAFNPELIRSLQAMTDRRIALKWYALALVLGCLGILLTIAMVSSFGTAAGNQFLVMVMSHKWLLIFVFVVVLTGHYADNRSKLHRYGN